MKKQSPNNSVINVLTFEDVVELIKNTFPNEEHLSFENRLGDDIENEFNIAIDMRAFSCLRKYIDFDNINSEWKFAPIIELKFVRYGDFYKKYILNDDKKTTKITKDSNLFNMSDDTFFLDCFSVVSPYFSRLRDFIIEILSSKKHFNRPFGILEYDFNSYISDSCRTYNYFFNDFTDFVTKPLDKQKAKIVNACNFAISFITLYNETKLLVTAEQRQIIANLIKLENAAKKNLDDTRNRYAKLIETKAKIITETDNKLINPLDDSEDGSI